jgi:hypothetical protein
MQKRPKSLIGMILGLLLMYPFLKLYENGYISSNMVIPAFFGGMFMFFLLYVFVSMLLDKDN